MTSQVLANVYLHEFDYFVRHTLKPLSYIRYGDDFLVIARTSQEALEFQLRGARFLQDNLQLTLHDRNNLVVPVHAGIHYLGVLLYSTSKTLSRKSLTDISDKLSFENEITYGAYVDRYGNKRQRQQFKNSIVLRHMSN